MCTSLLHVPVSFKVSLIAYVGELLLHADELA